MKLKMTSKNIKITICLFLSLAFLAGQSLAAGIKPKIEVGLSFGLRTLNNSELKDIYGQGTNFFPSVSLIWKGLMIGGGYEAGFKKDGLLGIYQEPAELTVKGGEIFAGYQLRLKNIAPYIKVGVGFYSYKQVVDSEYVSDYPVDGNKTGLIVAGGLKYFPLKKLFISAEVKYGGLKVKPYDTEVDLGGLRLNGGLGLSF
ncbi:MAG TPA: outer membrane beta-barrel protein [Candidatus Saccharicenans sp.]|mgnify:FL=1|nr:outer membrane beta-barrel protein [Candidatus Saccharicenans sp.]HQM74838.1 outer membrane beta-barrel protein [Candidatus Saccharicenans sp.]